MRKEGNPLTPPQLLPVDAPYRLLAQVEPMIERFIRVIEARTERLVTVIEFVSPTNKRSDGLQAFRQKRAELLASGVNFVEVDLNRSGNWRALLRPHLCPGQAVTPYRATVRVPVDPGATYLYPIGLRARLFGPRRILAPCCPFRCAKRIRA